MKRKGTASALDNGSEGEGQQNGNASESALNAQEGQEIRWPIVRLAGEWGVSEPTLYRILVGAGLDGSKGFEILAAAKLTVTHFRDKAESNARVGDEAATRKKVAEAEMSEIELEKKLGTIVLVDEARRAMEHVWIRGREIIRAFDGMTNDQKNELCEKLAAVVPFEDEPEH